MKRMLSLMLIAGLVVSGCGGQSAQKKPISDTINYERIDTNTESLKSNPQLNQWYSENYQREGIYTKDLDNKTYILVSAGQKSTGGYVMEVVNVIAAENIEIHTRVTEPKSSDFTTSVLTYPHVLIAIAPDNREIVWKNQNK